MPQHPINNMHRPRWLSRQAELHKIKVKNLRHVLDSDLESSIAPAPGYNLSHRHGGDPLIFELAATVNPPPEMTRGSSAVMLFTDSTFVLIVTVTPGTLMTALSLGPGTVSGIQLLATSQEPLVADAQETVAAKSWRDSSGSRKGCQPRERDVASRYI